MSPAPATRPREVVSELSDDTGITMQAAAEIIGCSYQSARDLVWSGALDAWRIGTGPTRAPIRVRLGSVRDYIAARTVIPINRAAAREAAKASPMRARSARQREAFLFIQRLGKKRAT